MLSTLAVLRSSSCFEQAIIRIPLALAIMLRFVVRDDGPGVAPQYREAIFSMFKMLKPRDQVEGSGMGLALVRKIVSRMGGACGVESAIARGAGFWFDWPKLPDAAESAP